MTQRLRVFVLLVGIAIGGAGSFQGSPQGRSPQDHTAWVADALQRMLTVKQGMTRGDLLQVFTTEGGLSSPWERTYVSRDCRYFKVDVKFQPVDGQVTSTEDRHDVIRTISRPYLQFPIGD
jgi:hypothetical protein